MRIGVDASLLARPRLTGIEGYVFYLLEGLAQVDNRNAYYLYCPRELAQRPTLGDNFTFYHRGPEPGDALDVFHLTGSYFWPAGYRGRAVITVHDLAWHCCPGDFSPEASSRLEKALHHSLGSVTRIIVPSRATARQLLRLYPDSAAHIDVIPLAPAPIFRPVSSEPGRQQVLARYGIRPPFLLAVGPLTGRKNLPRLIEALGWLKTGHPGTFPGNGAASPAPTYHQPPSPAEEPPTALLPDLTFRDAAPPQAPEDIRLVIAGAPLAPNEASLASHQAVITAIQQYGLTDQVTLPGFISRQDLAALYRAARAFVYLSLYEGFGLPVLEAMACGTPVIAADIPALRETTGDAALLVDPLDPAAIARAIAAVWSRADLRRQMQAKGLARGRAFSWKLVARQTLAALSAAGGEKKSEKGDR